MRAALTFAACACIASRASASPTIAGNGLSPRQLDDLRALGFAVAPDPVPPGFTIQSFHVDTQERTYEIVYHRDKDDASIRLEGAALGAGAPDQPEILSQAQQTQTKIQKWLNPFHKTETTTAAAPRTVGAEDTTPAIEAEHTDVVSDSPIVGPIHFQNGGACLTGTPDSSQSTITNAHFSVSACNLRYPDPLIRAYKSLAIIK